jgi:uncharacterized protein YacL
LLYYYGGRSNYGIVHLKKESERDINYLTVTLFVSLIIGLVVGLAVTQLLRVIFPAFPFDMTLSMMVAIITSSCVFLFFVWLKIKKIDKKADKARRKSSLPLAGNHSRID